VKILVTDGHLKAALSAVRSLGRRGFSVHTTQSRTGATMSSLSAFCRQCHVLPPYGDDDRFDTEFLELLRRERFDYVLPASDGAFRRISRQRESVREFTRVDLPPASSAELVLSKRGLLEFAQSLEIPIPASVYLSPMESLDRVLDTLRFPIVVKVGGARGAYDRVRYVNTVEELRRCVRDFRGAETIICQEYVHGTGYGFFAFMADGKPVATQMHERLWEYPITGGPSVFARTVDDPVVKTLALRLLDGLQWNGLAMVEFKRSSADGRDRLMEINPRLWGSLDLSIAAGVDFPHIAVARAARRSLPAAAAAPTSFLWVLPDALMFLLARPAKLLAFWRLVLSPRVKTNIAFDDLKPLFLQIRETFYWMKTLLRQRRLKYPHGRPGQPDGFAFDLHIHSSGSHDSVSSVKRILRQAVRRNLSAIAVTDHESVEGGKRARALNDHPDLAVIVGTEVKTEIGDVIGLFVEEPIQSRLAADVIREIKAQGGLVMLPHPFSYGVTEYDEGLIKELDLIEIRNSRNRKEQVDKVLHYAATYQLTMVGNSDAHFVSEIGSTHNVVSRPPLPPRSPEALKELLRSGNCRVVQSKTPSFRYALSQTVKALKGRRYQDVWFYGWWFLKSLIKDVVMRPLSP